MEIVLVVYWVVNIMAVFLAIIGVSSFFVEVFFAHSVSCFRKCAHAIIMSIASVAVIGFGQLVGSIVDAGSLVVGALAMVVALVGLVLAFGIDHHDHSVTRHYRRHKQERRIRYHGGYW